MTSSPIPGSENALCLQCGAYWDCEHQRAGFVTIAGRRYALLGPMKMHGPAMGRTVHDRMSGLERPSHDKR